MNYLYGCFAVIGGLILCAVIMAIMFYRAPDGWEDQDGFHRGEKPK
jgi:hypothetical protein